MRSITLAALSALLVEGASAQWGYSGSGAVRRYRYLTIHVRLMETPPSTSIAVPVTKLASSEAR